MKIISTRAHGMLDYIVGAIMIAAPWIFGFATGGPEQWIFVILGGAALVYSLLTNYELGAIKVLPMKAHLAIDTASGLLLALSPWLCAFSSRVSTPHVIFGLLELGVVMMSQMQTRRSVKVNPVFS